LKLGGRNLGKYQDQISLTIPNNLRYLPLILDSTAAFARILGLDDKKTNEVMLGVEEAVVNVIDHAFTEDEQASFELVFQKIALGMQVLIREQGMPFDPIELAKMGQRDRLSGEDTRGLGLHLMYKFIDEVSFVNLGKAGKETRLVKYLGRMPEAIESPQAEIHKPVEHIPLYEIRRMLPQEAIEVSKCAYMSYGYTYSNEHVYFPERLRQLNEEGKMVSLIAVSEDNEIMGHMALIFEGDDPLVPFVDDAFVKPQYRGAGCLNDLGAALMVWARTNGITGVYTWAVTSHPYSQKVAFKWGLSDTAILISVDLPLEFKAIAADGGQRESEAILFIYLRTMDTIKIYAPLHHSDMITQIYEHLGEHPEILLPGNRADLPDEEAILELKYEPRIIAFITIKKYGRNVLSEVSRMLKDLCLQRIETIYLNLPLNSPHTAVLTHAFEGMGFFFSGIMPGSEGRDQLILQYLNNQVLDYGQIKVNTEIGQKILAYIKRHDPNQMLEAE
jgi:serine/threonine-protein kinase RsbW